MLCGVNDEIRQRIARSTTEFVEMASALHSGLARYELRSTARLHGIEIAAAARHLASAHRAQAECVEHLADAAIEETPITAMGTADLQ